MGEGATPSAQFPGWYPGGDAWGPARWYPCETPDYALSEMGL